MNVILFDSTMITGNRSTMLLQLLTDHHDHVSEEQIYFVCLISSRAGIQTSARFFFTYTMSVRPVALIDPRFKGNGGMENAHTSIVIHLNLLKE